MSTILEKLEEVRALTTKRSALLVDIECALCNIPNAPSGVMRISGDIQVYSDPHQWHDTIVGVRWDSRDDRPEILVVLKNGGDEQLLGQSDEVVIKVLAQLVPKFPDAC